MFAVRQGCAACCASTLITHTILITRHPKIENANEKGNRKKETRLPMNEV